MESQLRSLPRILAMTQPCILLLSTLRADVRAIPWPSNDTLNTPFKQRRRRQRLHCWLTIRASRQSKRTRADFRSLRSRRGYNGTGGRADLMAGIRDCSGLNRGTTGAGWAVPAARVVEDLVHISFYYMYCPMGWLDPKIQRKGSKWVYL